MSEDLFRLIGLAEGDFRAGMAKLTEVRAQLASMNLPDSSRINCPECGVSLRGPRTLAEHVYLSHDGPEPEHWLEAEKAAAAGEP